MEVLTFTIKIIFLLLFIYLAFSGIYIFIFSIAGIFYKDSNSISDQMNKTVVLIPGYKEDEVIIDVAKKALEQSYPKELYDVVVIADSFNKDTLNSLRKLPILLVEVSFTKSTKAKALNAAMDKLPNDYQIGIVLDADNVMEYDFIKKINQAFNENTQVVQGHRMAKNMNTNFAILDALSEEINNHIFRKGHRVLNLSAALIGSGVAFDYHLFKDYMNRAKAVGGFDKELELNLLINGHSIKYLDKARVYDEKIQNTEGFEGQRRRWLAAQFIYFRQYYKQGLKSMIKFQNFDFVDKVIQMMLLPRILLIGLLGIVNILWLIIKIPALNLYDISYILPGHLLWLILFIIVSIAFVISIPRSLYKRQNLKALLSLPKGFFVMFSSLLKIKGANKKFIHTRHGKTSE